jgi:hypothetical protein
VFANWQTAKPAFDLLVDFTVLLGVPAGLIQFGLALRKGRQDRAYAAYDALDKEYIEFERFCFDHPRLDISGIDTTQSYQLTPEEQKQERIAFMVLISMFERAFIMYRHQPMGLKRRQWTGWEEYIDLYCKREKFCAVWRKSGTTTFDADFRDFMNRIVPPPATSSPPEMLCS